MKPLAILTLVALIFPNGLLANDTLKDKDTSTGNCSPKDTCSIPRKLSEDNLSYNNCQCSDSCRRYNSCCVDAFTATNARKTRISRRASNAFKCLQLNNTYLTIFVKATCKNRWPGGSHIKELCTKEPRDFKDPMVFMPVTNVNTKTTYKNYFCAYCNDDISNLQFWNIRVNQVQKNFGNYTFKSEDDIIKNLVYNEEFKEWGIYENKQQSPQSEKRYAKQINTFETVNILFEPSNEAQKTFEFCDSTLISDCHPRWINNFERQKCLSFMGMIYSRRNDSYPWVRYRNIHCANCNFASGDSSCSFAVGFGASYKPILNFSLLLDVNTSGGEKVGEISKCKKDEMYDPFFKKCRTLFCARPGYVMNAKTKKCEQG